MEDLQLKKLQSNQLLFAGILLFLLGLLVGFLIPVFSNPRMGLSTHLEGVLNGIFLVVLGLLWHRLALSNKLLITTFRLTIYGSFANFIAVLLGAIAGAGKMMPIAGGEEGTPIIEGIISFLLISLALAMVAVCILTLIGLYKNMASSKESTDLTS
jgi:(hydroxyamino)benzene mutase